MSDTGDDTPHWLERLGNNLQWLLLGSATLLVILVAFMVLVLGTNWIADVAPAVYGSLPGFVKNMAPFVIVAIVAILVGRRLFPEVDSDAE